MQQFLIDALCEVNSEKKFYQSQSYASHRIGTTTTTSI